MPGGGHVRRRPHAPTAAHGRRPMSTQPRRSAGSAPRQWPRRRGGCPDYPYAPRRTAQRVRRLLSISTDERTVHPPGLSSRVRLAEAPLPRPRRSHRQLNVAKHAPSVNAPPHPGVSTGSRPVPRNLGVRYTNGRSAVHERPECGTWTAGTGPSDDGPLSLPERDVARGPSQALECVPYKGSVYDLLDRGAPGPRTWSRAAGA